MPGKKPMEPGGRVVSYYLHPTLLTKIRAWRIAHNLPSDTDALRQMVNAAHTRDAAKRVKL